MNSLAFVDLRAEYEDALKEYIAAAADLRSVAELAVKYSGSVENLPFLVQQMKGPLDRLNKITFG